MTSEKIDYSFAENPTKLKQSVDAVIARNEKPNTENVKAEYIKRAGKLKAGHEVPDEDEEEDAQIDVETAKIGELKKFAKTNKIDIRGVTDVEAIRALIVSATK